MNPIIFSTETNPYYNVATEYQLFKKNTGGITLFLWQNEPSVFIGRNQNLYAECDVNYLEENHIYPVRRFSGGGAVYQDMGNLNFSFICPADKADIQQFKEYLYSAMKYLGFSCTYSGRNDLLINDRKFSGHAYYEEDNHFLYHGTLLYDVDLKQLEVALTPSKLKLNSKGISSVKSRVINLKELNPTLTLAHIHEALMKAFPGTLLPMPDSTSFPDITSMVKVLQSPSWIYGQAPAWNITLEHRFSFGLVTVNAEVKDGKIFDIHFFTDSLLPVHFSLCRQLLLGRWYSETEIIDVINQNMVSWRE